MPQVLTSPLQLSRSPLNINATSIADDEVLMPPPLPKAHSDPSTRSVAPATTPVQQLRPINGCLPRFPSADLGSPKFARRAERHPARRRSCPQLIDSHTRHAPTSSEGTAQLDAVSSNGPKACAEKATDQIVAESRPEGSPVFTLDLNADGFGLARRQSEQTTPISPALARDDPLANLARTVADRMSRSPRTRQLGAHTTGTSEESAGSAPAHPARQALARFTPVDPHATALAKGKGTVMASH